MKMKFLPKREILSLEECLRVARVFAELGVTKVRITGGEPLVRTNVEWLCAQIAKLQGVREVAITTNGSQLPRLACKLRSAGIRRINISLDTLDANYNFKQSFKENLKKVIAGRSINKCSIAWGVPPDSLRSWAKGTMPALDKAAELALRAGVSLNWLLGLSHDQYSPVEEIVRIPEYDTEFSAGRGITSAETLPSDRDFRRDFLGYARLNPDDLVMARVRGDSMAPTIPSASSVMFDLSQQDILVGSIYGVRLYDDLYIKYLRKTHTHIIMSGANSSYPPVQISTDEYDHFSVIGRVVWYSTLIN
jgi:phage repressor protein C with HTH and peptisase S24 domain